jgi:glutathionylspermidine synthase
VVQWVWLEELFPACDQFKSIHERLIAQWKEFDREITFCSMDDLEDATTIKYLLDTAQQAGLDGSLLPIGDIGWNGTAFVDCAERPLGTVFKLYPWEWIVREEFGKFLNASDTMWIEPAWKMLLSNKGILPILWELYPDHPNLLRASFDSPGAMTSWVRKPLLGREGANITLHRAGGDFETGGAYGREGFVYQEAVDIQAVIGSWVIGEEAAGIGVRESNTPIVTNTSRFVPHLFD